MGWLGNKLSARFSPGKNGRDGLPALKMSSSLFKSAEQKAAEAAVLAAAEARAALTPEERLLADLKLSPQALDNMPFLKEIALGHANVVDDMVGCVFDKQQQKDIVTCLTARAARVTHLDLRGTSTFIKHLSALLLSSTTMVVVDARNTKLGAIYSISGLLTAIQKCSSLKKMQFSPSFKLHIQEIRGLSNRRQLWLTAELWAPQPLVLELALFTGLVKDNRTLTHLCLAGVDLRLPGAKKVAAKPSHIPPRSKPPPKRADVTALAARALASAAAAPSAAAAATQAAMAMAIAADERRQSEAEREAAEPLAQPPPPPPKPTWALELGPLLVMPGAAGALHPDADFDFDDTNDAAADADADRGEPSWPSVLDLDLFGSSLDGGASEPAEAEAEERRRLALWKGAAREDFAIVDLLRWVQGSPTLQQLDLRGTHVGDSAVHGEYVAAAVCGNAFNQLRTVQLSAAPAAAPAALKEAEAPPAPSGIGAGGLQGPAAAGAAALRPALAKAGEGPGSAVAPVEGTLSLTAAQTPAAAVPAAAVPTAVPAEPIEMPTIGGAHGEFVIYPQRLRGLMAQQLLPTEPAAPRNSEDGQDGGSGGGGGGDSDEEAFANNMRSEVEEDDEDEVVDERDEPAMVTQEPNKHGGFQLPDFNYVELDLSRPLPPPARARPPATVLAAVADARKELAAGSTGGVGGGGGKGGAKAKGAKAPSLEQVKCANRATAKLAAFEREYGDPTVAPEYETEEEQSERETRMFRQRRLDRTLREKFGRGGGNAVEGEKGAVTSTGVDVLVVLGLLVRQRQDRLRNTKPELLRRKMAALTAENELKAKAGFRLHRLAEQQDECMEAAEAEAAKFRKSATTTTAICLRGVRLPAAVAIRALALPVFAAAITVVDLRGTGKRQHWQGEGGKKQQWQGQTRCRTRTRTRTHTRTRARARTRTRTRARARTRTRTRTRALTHHPVSCRRLCAALPIRARRGDAGRAGAGSRALGRAPSLIDASVHT
jgi:hypothetical protein